METKNPVIRLKHTSRECSAPEFINFYIFFLSEFSQMYEFCRITQGDSPWVATRHPCSGPPTPFRPTYDSAGASTSLAKPSHATPRLASSF